MHIYSQILGKISIINILLSLVGLFSALYSVFQNFFNVPGLPFIIKGNSYLQMKTCFLITSNKIYKELLRIIP